MIEVKKILFITLSNIGDCLLTLPALDALKQKFPGVKISVLVGERPKEIFENDPSIDKVLVFNKRAKLREKIKLFIQLRKEKFDMVVDLRNSFFGIFLPARYKQPVFSSGSKELKHMQDKHLAKLGKIKVDSDKISHKSFCVKPSDVIHIDKLLKEAGVIDTDRLLIIAPGARSHVKRWGAEKFVALIKTAVSEFGLKVILVGDDNDAKHAKYILENCDCGKSIVDFCAKTNLAQLGVLLKRAVCAVTNDSAVLHLASYLDLPVVAIFGPTDETKYGPWSHLWSVAKKDIFCRPCKKAQCKYGSLKCLEIIKPEDVLLQLESLLSAGSRQRAVGKGPWTKGKKNIFKRILIVRTDRIGDVLLSTPVIKALRVEFPSAYIAMMVSPYAREIVEDNPYLDEVIIFDKDNLHKNWISSIKFSRNLKKKSFDLALILHPTNRVHLITFFAGIKRRIGYNRKLGFLLTDRLEHKKQLGEKHESEYNFDLLRHLGINPKEKNLFIPLKKESEEYIEALLKEEGIKKTDKLLAIHPGASCLSKIWPQDRFAQVADRLVEKYGFKVLIVAGPKDRPCAHSVAQSMHSKGINLAGRTSISQLASLLKKCDLFISNDSGPVHIATALGTPVISLFGRSQKGLSPLRWGPLGVKDRILHKEVGCIECLAHNCRLGFKCLKSITVDDVINTVDSIFGDL
ncbi:MAG: lipopolysaccharide heptosyltransferase II [Candidatus Omnitrophica bacterium]|nr:lipopolysaccharide heptosyltransferase II [Candidatus Omnitrophota bacterium]